MLCSPFRCQCLDRWRRQRLKKIQMNQAITLSCLNRLWQEADGTENPYLKIKSKLIFKVSFFFQKGWWSIIHIFNRPFKFSDLIQVCLNFIFKTHSLAKSFATINDQNVIKTWVFKNCKCIFHSSFCSDSQWFKQLTFLDFLLRLQWHNTKL